MRGVGPRAAAGLRLGRSAERPPDHRAGTIAKACLKSAPFLRKINLLAYIRLQFLHLIIFAFPLYEINLSPSPDVASSFSLQQRLIHLSLPFLSLGIEFQFAVGGIHRVLRTPHCHPCTPLVSHPSSQDSGCRVPWAPAARGGVHAALYLLAHFVVQLRYALVGPILPEGGQNVAESI